MFPLPFVFINISGYTFIFGMEETKEGAGFAVVIVFGTVRMVVILAACCFLPSASWIGCSGAIKPVRPRWPPSLAYIRPFTLSIERGYILARGMPVDIIAYFQYYRNMTSHTDPQTVTRYADMFAAMGAEPRLRIMQLLLTAHPQGLVVGDIQQELEIPASTLSHHLDKLKNEELVRVRREGTFLWYSANLEALQAVIDFLYAECCTRNKAIDPGQLVGIGTAPKNGPERKSK
jgi:DNA-binding transcriptional ArsR family regulator